MSFSHYMFFVGSCREAMTAYHEIFGGDLQILTAADMPDSPPDAPGDLIMHAALTTGGTTLMASDDPTATEEGPKTGFSVSYAATDEADANRVFDALVKGGSVTMPVSPTSWSPAFGMCTDRFGVAWMVGVNAGE
jgi:PhnB protein